MILKPTPQERRWRERMERVGADGLMDRRCRPSPRRVPGRVVSWLLRQYKGRYRGFNVRHFHAVLVREHGFEYSYSFVKQVLQGAGLVKRLRPRGRHRLRHEPRALFGELLHIDGSRHRWLALLPEEFFSLIAVVDDATKQVLYAKLVDAEGTVPIFEALQAVFRRYGLPQALYSDRASWASNTSWPTRPRPGGVASA